MKKLMKFVGVMVLVMTVVFNINAGKAHAQLPGCPAGYVCIPLSASVSQTPTSIGSVPVSVGATTTNAIAALSATTSISTSRDVSIDPVNGASKVQMQNLYLVSAWGDTILTSLRVTFPNIDKEALPSTLYIYDGQTSIASVPVKNSTVDFSNLNISVAKDRTKTLTIKADFPTTASGYVMTTVTKTNSTYYPANNLSQGPRNLVITTNTLTGDYIRLKPSYVEWKLVSASAVGRSESVGVASSSITGTIVMKAIAHGGVVTKPVSSDFGVEFASSTVNKGISVVPVISSITPATSTASDQYTITITATLYSNNKDLGSNQSLFMRIKDIDYVITKSSGGTNTVTNQTWGIGDLYTNTVQITKSSGGGSTSGYVDWKLVNSTISTNQGMSGVASSSAIGSIVLRAIPHREALVKPQASDFNVNFVLANNTVIPVTPVVVVTPNTPTVSEGGEYSVTVNATLYSNNPLFTYSQPVYMTIKDIDGVFNGNVITNQPSNERTVSVQLDKNSNSSATSSAPVLKISLDPGSPAMGNVNGNTGDTIVLGVYDIVSNQSSSTLKTLNFDILVSGGKTASDIFSSVTVRTSKGPVNLTPQTHMTFDNINKVLMQGQITPVYITATLNKSIPNGTRTYVRVTANKDNVKAVDSYQNPVAVENTGVVSSNILTFITTNPAAAALLWNAVKQLFAF